MSQSLFGRDGIEIGKRRLAERAARCSEHQTADFPGLAAAQALVHGVVFAVDGKEFAACFFGGGHDQFAGSDQNFFIGERHGLAEFHGFIGGFQSDYANGGGNDNLGTRKGRDCLHSFAPVVNAGQRRDAFGAEALGKFVGFLRVGNGNNIGTVALDL